MNAYETLETMSPTMIRSLRAAMRGEPINKQQLMALEARGCIAASADDGSLTVTSRGKTILALTEPGAA